eukprot:Clim_evm20s4 gene=Clim_evmTU20s4
MVRISRRPQSAALERSRSPLPYVSTFITEPAVGHRVTLSEGRTGVVRYVGTVHFARGTWIGIELDGTDPGGRHEGTVDGIWYFNCRSRGTGKGLLVSLRSFRAQQKRMAQSAALEGGTVHEIMERRFARSMPLSPRQGYRRGDISMALPGRNAMGAPVAHISAHHNVPLPQNFRKDSDQQSTRIQPVPVTQRDSILREPGAKRSDLGDVPAVSVSFADLMDGISDNSEREREVPKSKRSVLEATNRRLREIDTSMHSGASDRGIPEITVDLGTSDASLAHQIGVRQSASEIMRSSIDTATQDRLSSDAQARQTSSLGLLIPKQGGRGLRTSSLAERLGQMIDQRMAQETNVPKLSQSALWSEKSQSHLVPQTATATHWTTAKSTGSLGGHTSMNRSSMLFHSAVSSFEGRPQSQPTSSVDRFGSARAQHTQSAAFPPRKKSKNVRSHSYVVSADALQSFGHFRSTVSDVEPVTTPPVESVSNTANRSPVTAKQNVTSPPAALDNTRGRSEGSEGPSTGPTAPSVPEIPDTDRYSSDENSQRKSVDVLSLPKPSLVDRARGSSSVSFAPAAVAGTESLATGSLRSLGKHPRRLRRSSLLIGSGSESTVNEVCLAPSGPTVPSIASTPQTEAAEVQGFGSSFRHFPSSAVLHCASVGSESDVEIPKGKLQVSDSVQAVQKAIAEAAAGESESMLRLLEVITENEINKNAFSKLRKEVEAKADLLSLDPELKQRMSQSCDAAKTALAAGEEEERLLREEVRRYKHELAQSQRRRRFVIERQATDDLTAHGLVFVVEENVRAPVDPQTQFSDLRRAFDSMINMRQSQLAVAEANDKWETCRIQLEDLRRELMNLEEAVVETREQKKKGVLLDPLTRNLLPVRQRHIKRLKKFERHVLSRMGKAAVLRNTKLEEQRIIGKHTVLTITEAADHRLAVLGGESPASAADEVVTAPSSAALEESESVLVYLTDQLYQLWDVPQAGEALNSITSHGVLSEEHVDLLGQPTGGDGGLKPPPLHDPHYRRQQSLHTLRSNLSVVSSHWGQLVASALRIEELPDDYVVDDTLELRAPLGIVGSVASMSQIERVRQDKQPGASKRLESVVSEAVEEASDWDEQEHELVKAAPGNPKYNETVERLQALQPSERLYAQRRAKLDTQKNELRTTLKLLQAASKPAAVGESREVSRLRGGTPGQMRDIRRLFTEDRQRVQQETNALRSLANDIQGALVQIAQRGGRVAQLTVLHHLRPSEPSTTKDGRPVPSLLALVPAWPGGLDFAREATERILSLGTSLPDKGTAKPTASAGPLTPATAAEPTPVSPTSRTAGKVTPAYISPGAASPSPDRARNSSTPGKLPEANGGRAQSRMVSDIRADGTCTVRYQTELPTDSAVQTVGQQRTLCDEESTTVTVETTPQVSTPRADVISKAENPERPPTSKPSTVEKNTFATEIIGMTKSEEVLAQDIDAFELRMQIHSVRLSNVVGIAVPSDGLRHESDSNAGNIDKTALAIAEQRLAAMQRELTQLRHQRLTALYRGHEDSSRAAACCLRKEIVHQQHTLRQQRVDLNAHGAELAKRVMRYLTVRGDVIHDLLALDRAAVMEGYLGHEDLILGPDDDVLPSDDHRSQPVEPNEAIGKRLMLARSPLREMIEEQRAEIELAIALFLEEDFISKRKLRRAERGILECERFLNPIPKEESSSDDGRLDGKTEDKEAGSRTFHPKQPPIIDIWWALVLFTLSSQVDDTVRSTLIVDAQETVLRDRLKDLQELQDGQAGNLNTDGNVSNISMAFTGEHTLRAAMSADGKRIDYVLGTTYDQDTLQNLRRALIRGLDALEMRRSILTRRRLQLEGRAKLLKHSLPGLSDILKHTKGSHAKGFISSPERLLCMLPLLRLPAGNLTSANAAAESLEDGQPGEGGHLRGRLFARPNVTLQTILERGSFINAMRRENNDDLTTEEDEVPRGMQKASIPAQIDSITALFENIPTAHLDTAVLMRRNRHHNDGRYVPSDTGNKYANHSTEHPLPAAPSGPLRVRVDATNTGFRYSRAPAVPYSFNDPIADAERQAKAAETVHQRLKQLSETVAQAGQQGELHREDLHDLRMSITRLKHDAEHLLSPAEPGTRRRPPRDRMSGAGVSNENLAPAQLRNLPQSSTLLQIRDREQQLRSKIAKLNESIEQARRGPPPDRAAIPVRGGALSGSMLTDSGTNDSPNATAGLKDVGCHLNSSLRQNRIEVAPRVLADLYADTDGNDLGQESLSTSQVVDNN